VPEHGHGLQPEVAPDAVDVVDLGPKVDVLGPNAARRAAATTLVVVDEAERLRQPVELGKQIRVVEVRPAVEHEDRIAGADVAAKQWIHCCGP
jgi:hypothetical protein